MAGQLGLQGIAIPERFGGSGFSFVELAIVLEETGRALLVAPYFSSAVLGAYSILDSGDETAAAELLPGIADGSRIATLAFTEDEWTVGPRRGHHDRRGRRRTAGRSPA